METITFKGQTYPKFQAQGNAAQFAIPFAKHFCAGTGYDIGYSKQEWKLPGAIGIDLVDDSPYHANHLPSDQVDYIFSSHCLEHVDNWVETLEYWQSRIKHGGVIMLYLPDISQNYWRPWHNRKHKHVFTPEIFKAFFQDHQWEARISGVDLNNSFVVVAVAPVL